MLIDSHCHLDHLDLGAHDGRLDAALDAARAAGVSGFLCVGADPDPGALRGVLDISERFTDVWASAGIHPLEVDGSSAQRTAVAAVLDHARVVAIGETGLDFFKDGEVPGAGRDAQIDSFAWHLVEGGRRGLPVIVHTREARAETLACIRDHGDPRVAGVMHCFAEDWDTAVAAMDLGYLISISGIVTFRSADALREVVRRVPLERLLVETDSPWLSPAPMRGRPNEPARVRRVAECVAELRGLSLEALGEATSANFHALFPKAGASAARGAPATADGVSR